MRSVVYYEKQRQKVSLVEQVLFGFVQCYNCNTGANKGLFDR